MLAAIFAAAGWQVGDEIVHFQQIDLFRARRSAHPGCLSHGDPRLSSCCRRRLGADRRRFAWRSTPRQCRLSALFAIGGFLALRRTANPASAGLATAQFTVLPILVPFFFLVYTDVLSLVIGTVGDSGHGCVGRHGASALALLCALGIRQTNVVWTLLLMAMTANSVHAQRPQRFLGDVGATTASVLPASRGIPGLLVLERLDIPVQDAGDPASGLQPAHRQRQPGAVPGRRSLSAACRSGASGLCRTGRSTAPSVAARAADRVRCNLLAVSCRSCIQLRRSRGFRTQRLASGRRIGR